MAEVLVFQSDYVEASDVLVRLYQDIAALAVAAAEASLARSEAVLIQAQGKLGRVERLSATGVGSEVALIEDETGLALAETALADTVIRAPIADYVENPLVRVGTLLEFDVGAPPLFQIV